MDNADSGLFDIKSMNFLGGNNVHNVITIGLLGLLVYKAYK
tara:strand:+ start:608 stop:730 length:123 start_codon:yes stop_codon:yes gene_type:complete